MYLNNIKIGLFIITLLVKKGNKYVIYSFTNNKYNNIYYIKIYIWCKFEKNKTNKSK